MSDFTDVRDFHLKFGLGDPERGLPLKPGPREVSLELLSFRLKFLQEEFGELLEGVGAVLDYSHNIIFPNQLKINHAKTFDALIDLVYVALGTALLMGYPWPAGWQLVQRANMMKVRAARDGSDSARNSGWDVVKPPGWTPPDIEGLLADWGWPTKGREIQ
jgi:predicted HAD superfamily Cof-like phosphohydrolase